MRRGISKLVNVPIVPYPYGDTSTIVVWILTISSCQVFRVRNLDMIQI